MSHQNRRLGELLKAASLVNDEHLARALEEQNRSGGRLGEILVRQGVLGELQLIQVLSNQLSVAWVSLPHVDFTEELLMLVPPEVAEQHTLIPVHFRIGKQKEKILYVAMDDPTNVAAMEQVSRITGMHVRPLIAPTTEIRRHIQARYRMTRGTRRPAPA
jgi:type IV pilus assembly protein PilB